MAAPANDNFASAQVVTLFADETYTTDPIPSTEATTEAGEPVLGTEGGAKSVWFTITPETSGTLSVDTAESAPLAAAVATHIGLYTGSSVDTLTLVADNAVAADALEAGETWSELVDVPLTGGVTYHLQVGLATSTSDDVEYVVRFDGTGLFPTWSDLAYANDGYDYTGTSENLTDPPLMAPPVGESVVVIGRDHVSLPVPTLVDGEPVGWVATHTPGTDWGNTRVTVDDVDVTWFRDVATLHPDVQHTDPYGPNNATLVFPAISYLDAQVPSTAIPWLREGAKVRIDQVRDGEVVDRDDPPFRGIVDAIEQGRITQVTCSGWFSGRAATIAHQPRITDPGRQDAAQIIRHHLGNNRHWDLYAPADGTGIKMNRRGSRDMTLLGAIDDILSLAITEDGDSWTLMPAPSKSGKALRLKKRDMSTVHYTVHAGAQGVDVKPRSDRVDKVNRVYAEGTTPQGERVRNAKYPNLPPHYAPPFPHSTPLVLGMTDADTDTGDGITVLAREMWGNGDLAYDDAFDFGREFTDEIEDAVKEVQRDLGLPRTGEVDAGLWAKIFSTGFAQQSFRQAHFEPFAYDPAAVRWLRGPDGTLVGFNPDYDPDVEKNDLFVGMGDHVTKRQMKKHARAIIKRQAATNVVVTLTSDPEECSRLNIRAGKVINIKHLFGSGLTGVDLYISSVQFDWGNPQLPVTLACSTTARHYLDLATIKARRMEARRDPAAQWRHQLRRSNIVSDTMQGWEGESGAGIVRARQLQRGWNLIPMVASESGTIGDLHLTTHGPPRRFYAFLFGEKPSVKKLRSVLGSPDVWADKEDEVTKAMAHMPWLRTHSYVESWGTPAQPCGYGDKAHTNPKGKITDAPVTGEMRDEGTWTFGTRKNFLWWAVWVPGATTIKGSAKIVPDDGN